MNIFTSNCALNLIKYKTIDFRTILASPAVAIKFGKIPRGQLIHVECKAWYKGVVHDKRYGKGMTRFEILVESEIES